MKSIINLFILGIFTFNYNAIAYVDKDGTQHKRLISKIEKIIRKEKKNPTALSDVSNKMRKALIKIEKAQKNP